MADIFISYKKSDYKIASAIADIFEAEGYSVWWDTHLQSGEEWFRRILTEVDESKCLIGVWTEQSVDDFGLFRPSVDDGHNYIQAEHNRAGREKVIGVLLSPKRVPVLYDDKQAAELLNWNLQDSAHPEIQKLIFSVKQLIDRKGNRKSPTGSANNIISSRQKTPKLSEPWFALTAIIAAMGLSILAFYFFWGYGSTAVEPNKVVVDKSGIVWKSTAFWSGGAKNREWICETPPKDFELIIIETEHRVIGKNIGYCVGEGSYCDSAGEYCVDTVVSEGCLINIDWLNWYKDKTKDELLPYSDRVICAN